MESNLKKDSSRYLTKFLDKESEPFYYLPLIQENSPLSKNLFFPANPDLDKYRTDLFHHLDVFSAIYVPTFSGDEREEVHKILGRILPQSYQQEMMANPVYFKNTCEALLKPDNEESGTELSQKEVEALQQKLAKEINDYQQNRALKEVKNGSGNDQTIITLCLKEEGDELTVVGGMILEYYSSRVKGEQALSHCILTYLFFEESSRSRGLGAYFIKQVLPIVTQNKIWIKGRNEPIRPSYVFLEADNPVYADGEEAVEDADKKEVEYATSPPASKKKPVMTDEEKAKKKLKFFSDNGARWLDICYVQPRLSPDQSRVYNLLFLILPEVSEKLGNAFTIKKSHVLTFLVNFYRNLEENQEFHKNLEGSREKFELKMDSSTEVPLYSISKLDVDLARSYLAIEVADALDDFENNLQYDIVVRLRSLQKDLENQLDFIADVTKGLKPQDAQLVAAFLEPLFMGQGGTNEDDSSVQQYSNNYLHLYEQLEKNDKIRPGKIQTIIEDIKRKKTNIEEASAVINKTLESSDPQKGADSTGIRPLSAIWQELYNILKEDKKTADQKKSKTAGPPSREDLLQATRKPTAIMNETFYLKEIPQFEAPKFQFDKSSIAFTIALNQHVDSKYFEFSRKNEEGNVTIDYLKDENGKYRIDYTNKSVKCEVQAAKLLHLKPEDKKSQEILTFDELDCSIFKSYENDLFAFNYYEEKSRTKNKSLATFTVEVTFPYKIEFLSEGRKESLFLNVSDDPFQNRIDGEEKKYFTYKKRLKGFLNVMYFQDDIPKELSDRYRDINGRNPAILNDEDKDVILDYEVAKAKSLVWNIVFTNDRNEMNERIALSEYEIIGLAKLFSGKQERSYVDIKFENIIPKTDSEHIKYLLNQLFFVIETKIARKSNSLYDIHSGVIQIDTLNTKIFSKNKKRDSGGKIKFTDVFESDSDIRSKIDKQNKLKHRRHLLWETNPTKQNIYILLEEYLKDNVDNIALLDQLYPAGEPDEEARITYREVYRNARDFHYDDAFTGFEDRYTENVYLQTFFNALCGISLGIFDFNRMGYEEVTDTILPLKESATDKSMIIMKRGSLFNCCHENSVFDSSIGTIGMSPYLIIPNSVLVYNRIHADHYVHFQANIMKLSEDDISDDDFVRYRKEAHNDLNFNSSDLYQILLKLRRRTESYFENIYIPNIFNYPTEQEIYKIGMNDRGIDEVYYKIKDKKEELDEKITDLVNIRNTIFNLLITIFLGLSSITGLYDFLNGEPNDEVKNGPNTAAQSITKENVQNFRSFHHFEFPSGSGPLSGHYINIGTVIFVVLLIMFTSYFGSRLNQIIPKYITVDLNRLFYKPIIRSSYLSLIRCITGIAYISALIIVNILPIVVVLGIVAWLIFFY